MNIRSIKNKLIQNAKNIYGWKTKRKIVVFSVDDYGNVRVDSKKARENMDKAGLMVYDRFDAFDTLETTEDLEMLFEVLSSVKDKNGNNAIFTPFAMPANINFEKMAENGFSKYEYELLPETFAKLGGQYQGAWVLWNEGITKRLMVPQFHGREHLNLKVFEEALERNDHETLTALKNRSYTSISTSGYSTIAVSAAFEFWKFEENKRFDKIISEGLDLFEKVYGYRSVHFNAPGASEHPVIHSTLLKSGIKYIDTPLIKNEHQGEGKYKRVLNYTGKKNKEGQTLLVRNCVFEPTDNRGFDWVSNTIEQIETAFRWNRPAIISSHRVAFCGHIDPKNRKVGLDALKNLLHEIVKKWPDVEFMSANELGDLVAASKIQEDL